MLYTFNGLTWRKPTEKNRCISYWETNGGYICHYKAWFAHCWFLLHRPDLQRRWNMQSTASIKKCVYSHPILEDNSEKITKWFQFVYVTFILKFSIWTKRIKNTDYLHTKTLFLFLLTRKNTLYLAKLRKLDFSYKITVECRVRK